MKIDEIRIYAEVLEQGIDFKEYINKINHSLKVINIYTKKARGEINSDDSLTDRIRKSKDVDVLITIISNKNEYPLLMVEYSTAVPTDDHKMQRSDVYYWSSVYHVPMMKIYPSNKGMGQDFGGGDKFNDELEAALAFNQGAIFYPIIWKNVTGLDTLETKKNALSCIYFSHEILTIISDLYNSFLSASNFKDYYSIIRKNYQNKNFDFLNKYANFSPNSIIVDSTRFKWSGNKLISKINRFGHAMDPDRGVLYFTNMLVGIDNCVTEIQVNRSSLNGRGGYGSLFDSCSRENVLISKVTNIINNQNNVFSCDDAIDIFETALCIENWHLFNKLGTNTYSIDDKKLNSFLINCPSMTAKCIFYLSSELILTDKDRNTICSVTWNSKIVNSYLMTLDTNNYRPIIIKDFEFNDAKEDIVTFASVELYKRLNCDLLAVSYPGAQGDRCVLYGTGRNVLRTYIDIIALKEKCIKATVFLEECKESISNSKDDVKKLNDFISSSEQIDGLKNLMKRVRGKDKINDIKIAVGSKHTNSIPNYKVDYIFMFDIRNTSDKTIIDYSVAVIDTTLLKDFKVLQDKYGKLRGSIYIDKIYIIE